MPNQKHVENKVPLKLNSDQFTFLKFENPFTGSKVIENPFTGSKVIDHQNWVC